MEEAKEKNKVEKKDKQGLSIASLILSIMSIISILLGFLFDTFLLLFIIPIICIVLTIVLGVESLKSTKRKIAIASIIIVVISSIVYIFLLGVMIHNQISNTINANNMYRDYQQEGVFSIDKPIIYLYPEEETEVSVELPYSDRLIVSYPKYVDRWKVLAKENGDLVDLDTGRNLYSLYYESKSAIDFKVEDEGFVVKGEDSAKFLEEKLAVLGLNEREAEEFIIYWLPKLESNKYNYIRFASEEEINKNMPLEISPKPDTTIRVLMVFKGLDKPIEVEEQKLETTERKGFVAVEWGGTEIK